MDSKSSPPAYVTPPAAASTSAPATEDVPTAQGFTATGKPMPALESTISASDKTTPDGSHVPWRYTDTDLICVPIPLPPSYQAQADRGKPSLLKRVKAKVVGPSAGTNLKVVKMPRAEYLAHWARDEKGNYVGTEPEGTGKDYYADGVGDWERKKGKRVDWSISFSGPGGAG